MFFLLQKWLWYYWNSAKGALKKKYKTTSILYTTSVNRRLSEDLGRNVTTYNQVNREIMQSRGYGHIGCSVRQAIQVPKDMKKANSSDQFDPGPNSPN